MKDSIIVALTLLLGVAFGYWGESAIVFDVSSLTSAFLIALLFCVGISIGSDTTLFSKIKNIHPAFLLLPLITIIGTLAGSASASIFLPHRTPYECMAVGSGFAYYSLSSILITQIKGVELGVIALMSNIIREVIVLVFAAQLARYFGKTAPICCAGATSMDSTLPFITRASGAEFVIVALIHGILVDFSVPFLVTYFCNN